MERLRQKLTRRVARAAVWLLLRIAPYPPVPEPCDWTVKLTNKGAPDRVIVLFKRSLYPGVGWHVGCLVDWGNGWVLVGDSNRTLLTPLTADFPWQVLARRDQTDYAVTVETDLGKRMVAADELMAASCVETVKRTIGLDRPGIYTPRQLIAELWRLR